VRRARALGVAALLVLAALIAGGAWVAASLQEPYAGWRGTDAVVTLPPGTPASGMVDALARAGVVRSPRVLKAWIKLRGSAGRLQAGTYRFDRALSALDVLRKIEAGEVMLQAVTIPEGLDRWEIASRLAEAGLGQAEEFLRLSADPRPIRDLDPQARDLEGYLFPDTYYFPVGETPERVTEALLRRFRQVATAEYRAEAARLGLTLREAVTLASLIEEETSVPAERPRISRVFHNRLARGMRLECDPTVLYGLRRAGETVGRLLVKHLRHESPWNTYVVTGLPAGPIASPGRASLEAAVRPAASGDELYFVAAPGGGHRFSSDLRTHLAAVAAWRDYVRSR
jgi:UPF0755 protein